MSESINLRGAVDLGALAARNEAQSRAAQAPAGVVVDVTDATFQTEVIERSRQVPVLIDLWADWCQPCKILSPILESLAAEYAGRWVLAKIDIEAEQRIAAAFQVQSIPSVFAVIQGQPIPLFQGALPEPQVRDAVEQVLAAAAQAGLSANGAPPEAPRSEAPEPPADPDLEQAYSAMESADWAGAQAAFDRILTRDPKDREALAGQATAALYQRVEAVDPEAARAAATAPATDVTAQVLAADLAVAAGDPESAFSRLIGAVRATRGEDRAAAREHLLALFEVVGGDDPRVASARRGLASALF